MAKLQKNNSLLLSTNKSETEETLKIMAKSDKLEFEVHLHKEEQNHFDATRDRWYIIPIMNPYKFYWDLFVILLAIYSAISLPMQISFVAVQNLYDDSFALGWVERMVDIFFAIDIIVNFLTAYIEVQDGETITQPKRIAKNYLGGGFIPDFISTTPLVLRPLIDGVTMNSGTQELLNNIILGFRLMKLMRIRKFSTVITNLQQPIQIKSSLKRLYVIFLLVLICHVQGCIIMMIMEPGGIWVAPTDFGLIEVNTFSKDVGFAEQYLRMVYHSTLVYSMVDISARSDSELVWVSGLIILSAIINAIIYGQFANLTEELKQNSNEFLNKLNLVNSVMANEALSMEIKSDVRDYILTTHNLKRLQDEQ